MQVFPAGQFTAVWALALCEIAGEIPVSWSPLFQQSDNQGDGMSFSPEYRIHPGLEVEKLAIAMVPIPTAMVLNKISLPAF